MTSRAATEYRYEKLTWPEINDAIDMGKVCVIPCGAVEQHGLDPRVVMEVLKVTQVGNGGGDVGMQVRRAVAGDLKAAVGSHGGGPLPFGDAAAAGDVGLEAVDGPAVDHAREVGQVVAVLARGDVGTHLVAHGRQPFQVI